MDSAAIPLAEWVAPFGDPRIKACSRLPQACRSVPRPSSPLGAKASTRCPCFPRPPPAATAPCTPPVCDLTGPRPARPKGRAKRRPKRQLPPGTIPASTANHKCRPIVDRGGQAPSIPMPNTRPATDGTKRAGRRRLAGARRPRRMPGSLPPCPTTGTSSPPHDVQATRPPPGPNGPAMGADGVRLPRAAGQRPGPRRPRRPGRGGTELVGLGRLERPTSRLSGVRSNQLSYRPEGHPAGPERRRCRAGAEPRDPSPADLPVRRL